MAKVDLEYRDAVMAKLEEMFPQAVKDGVVSRAQILEIRDEMGTTKYPNFLMKDKIGRGVYALPGSKTALPVSGNTALKTTQAEESVVVDYSNTTSLVPAKDGNYVPFGNYQDLERVIKTGVFYPAYVYGPTGNGKSTMVEQICAKHGKPLIRVNLNQMVDEEQLIGSKTLVDGNVMIVEGPVLIAMRTGTTLLLDEIDAGAANTLLCLQPILEGKPYYFKLKNELITPKAGFNIIATANTKGKGSDDGRYIGTNVLNEAFLERFAVTFEQDYPSARVEKAIVTNLMIQMQCMNQEFCDTLVKWADAIRRTFDDGGVDETITTRRMAHIVRAYAIFRAERKAIELCVNRFDDATKLAFLDLYDKVSADPTAFEEEQTEEAVNQ